jgi:hypothetical protein
MAYKFGSVTLTNSLNIGYIGNQTGNFTSIAGTTLVPPSGLNNENHAIYLSKTAFGISDWQSGTFIDCAIFNSAKTLAECKDDIEEATWRLKCNEGYGATLYNSGTAGSDYDMTASGITEETFHTIIKDT